MVDSGIMVQILAWTFAGLAAVKGLSDFLNFVSKKTKTKTDDKIANYLAKGIGFVSKLLDYISANSRSKEK